jgi:large subunit ribosomal protein L24e
MDCSFCGVKIPKGTEYIYVTSKGKALYFCTGKCLKNRVKLKRKPRKVRWTKTYMTEKAGRVKSAKTPPKEKPQEKAQEKPKPAAPKEAPAKSEAKKKAKPKKKKKPAAESGKDKAEVRAETKKTTKKAKKKA